MPEIINTDFLFGGHQKFSLNYMSSPKDLLWKLDAASLKVRS